MKVVLFGASGMVGQGVLRECLLDDSVESVVSVVRKPTGTAHPKLREVVHTNFDDFSALEAEFSGIDACSYCLGVSSAGMNERDYERVTYGYTVAAARALLQASPGLCFGFVSGAGTSSERGRVMWARVKGRAENALLSMPFSRAVMFRPGVIQPLFGIRSKTRAYRVLYGLTKPLFPALRALFPRHVLTTEQLGRAMLRALKHGAPKPILDAPDIADLAAAATADLAAAATGASPDPT